MRSVLLLTGCIGCTPLQRATPAYFAERAQVLAAGDISVTGAAGAGADLGGGGIGLGGRVRVGIGNDQEVGIEGSVLDIQQDIDEGWGDPQEHVDTLSLGSKLSWKCSVSSFMAVVLGAGLTQTTRTGGDDTSQYFAGTAASGDVGLLFSQSRSPSRIVPYAGIRVGATTALGAAHENTTTGMAGVLGTVTASFGADIPLGPGLHGFLEGGPTFIIDHAGADDTPLSFGAYALAGLSIAFDHSVSR